MRICLELALNSNTQSQSAKEKNQEYNLEGIKEVEGTKGVNK